MMKKLLSILAAAMVSTATAQPKIVELPLTMHNGYDAMNAGMGGLVPYSNDPNDPWSKTRVKVSRLPEGLSDVKMGDLETNFRQFCYQNFLADNITPERYAELQKGNLWTPDTHTLSKTPVRTTIAFARGIDADGVKKIVLDTNGNLDLSDDAQFVPINMDDANVDDKAKRDSMWQTLSVRARVETFTHGKVLQQEVPILVTHSAAYDLYFANIGRYATTEYRGQKIAVNSGNFINLSFNDPVVKLGDEYYEKGEYVTIGGETLKIMGVDTNKNVLVLEHSDVPPAELYSTQTGFAAHSFSGEEFTTHAPVALESLRGKYVFLDFWATWCGPCITEMPNLRALYGKTPRERFEIVGIVGRSEAADLTSSIKEHGIVWPQILSDEICKLYGVIGYPTTLLIDPNGVIVAKNLRGAELEKRVIEILTGSERQRKY